MVKPGGGTPEMAIVLVELQGSSMYQEEKAMHHVTRKEGDQHAALIEGFC
jgi:hypothetical protein